MNGWAIALLWAVGVALAVITYRTFPGPHLRHAARRAEPKWPAPTIRSEGAYTIVDIPNPAADAPITTWLGRQGIAPFDVPVPNKLIIDRRTRTVSVEVIHRNPGEAASHVKADCQERPDDSPLGQHTICRVGVTKPAQTHNLPT